MARILVILAILGILAYIGNAIYTAGETAERAFWQQRVLDNKKDAEKRLQAAQNRLKSTYQRQYDEIQAINDALVADNQRLHERSNRLPEASRAACKGSSGSELSRPDAQFLIGQSAECQRQQINLKAHYDYVDEVERLYINKQ